MKKTKALFTGMMLAALMLTGIPTTHAQTAQTGLYYDVYNWSNPESIGIYSYTKGQGEKKIIDDIVHGQVYVQGDWIYYMMIEQIEGQSGQAQKGHLYKIKADGSSRTQVLEEKITSMSVDGDVIYYTLYKSEEDQYGIWKMNLDGTGSVKLSDDKSFGQQVVNGWIYYINASDETRLYRMKTDGTGKNKLDDVKFGNLGEDSVFTVAGDYVVYGVYDNGFKSYLIKGDGTGKIDLGIDDVNFRKIVGDTLYFTRYNEEYTDRPAFLYSMKLDGKALKKVATVPPERLATYVGTTDNSIVYRTASGQILTVVESGKVVADYDVTTDQPGIQVRIEGRLQSYDQPPVVLNDRTMVPLRGIFEALGSEIEWDGATQTVTAIKGDTTISLKIGATTATKNGETIHLDTPAQIVGGRSMVPVRFVSEALGADVSWDGTTQTVFIHKK